MGGDGQEMLIAFSTLDETTIYTTAASTQFPRKTEMNTKEL